MGVLQLVRKYSDERLEKPCNKAIHIKSFIYTTVSNILKNGQEDTVVISQTPRLIPVHSNIRNNYK